MAYGSGPDVLRDIDLTLQAGSLHVLTGESGAGKTSLLKIIGLTRPLSQGQIHLFGQDVTRLRRAARPAVRRRIGMIFQDFRLLDHLTAFDNVALPLRITGMDDTEVTNSVSEMMSWLGIVELAGEHPPRLSMGQRQLLAAARAVVTRPALILADEPTSHLDPDRSERLIRLFIELKRMGTTIMIATHNSDGVRRFASSQHHVHEGRIWPLQPDRHPVQERHA